MIQATRTALKLSTGTIRPPLMERSTDGWRAGAGDLCRVRLPSTTKLSRAPRITVLSPTGLCPNRRGRNCENAFHEAHVESPLRELSLSALTNREPNNPVVAAMPEEFRRKADLVDAAAAVTLVLNYLVAYQVLRHRSHVQAGDRVLIVGAGVGIGTALCELGQLAGLVMYGVDS